jgi:polyisoprenoid-binding protein YceI
MGCRLAIAPALALFTGVAMAEPVEYAIDRDLTRVHWEVLHFGTSTSRGRFDRIDGSITLDRAARRGEVSITVDTASVSTGFAPFDNVLRGGYMLAVAEHPQAWFVASRIEFDGDAPRKVRGEITLRGVGRPLELVAERFACRPAKPGEGEICGGDFSAELRRSDFGIDYALPFAADRVRLRVAVEAQRR